MIKSTQSKIHSPIIIHSNNFQIFIKNIYQQFITIQIKFLSLSATANTPKTYIHNSHTNRPKSHQISIINQIIDQNQFLYLKQTPQQTSDFEHQQIRRRKRNERSVFFHFQHSDPERFISGAERCRSRGHQPLHLQLAEKTTLCRFAGRQLVRTDFQTSSDIFRNVLVC